MKFLKVSEFHFAFIFGVMEFRYHSVLGTLRKWNKKVWFRFTKYLIHSGFEGLLLRNYKWSPGQSLRFWNFISFRFRNSEWFTKHIAILLPFSERWNSVKGVPQTLNRSHPFLYFCCEYNIKISVFMSDYFFISYIFLPKVKNETDTPYVSPEFSDQSTELTPTNHTLASCNFTGWGWILEIKVREGSPKYLTVVQLNS